MNLVPSTEFPEAPGRSTLSGSRSQIRKCGVRRRVSSDSHLTLRSPHLAHSSNHLLIPHRGATGRGPFRTYFTPTPIVRIGSNNATAMQNTTPAIMARSTGSSTRTARSMVRAVRASLVSAI